MSAGEWKALVRMHRFSDRRFRALVNSVFVGGRPDDGHAYGYMGWDGESGVLVARNPNVRAQTLRVPIGAETLYRGTSRGPFRSRILYPYRGDGPAAPQGPLEVTLPGYATMVLEIAPGKGGAPVAAKAAPAVRRQAERLTLEVPDEAMARCDLIVIGYPTRPDVHLAGAVASPQRSESGEPNRFARYARAGMVRETARPWSIASYDLAEHRGRHVEVTFDAVGDARFEAWWILDRPVAGAAPDDGPADEPWAITDGYRRQTIELPR